MSDYSIVPNAALTATADAIRTKSGSQATIEFDNNTGFKDAVDDIPSGSSKKYIIRDGAIQSGYTAQTVSPALITEESGGYVHLSVTGNEYCTAYFNGVDFSGYDFLIVEFYNVNNACGWSWSSVSNGVPAISVGNGNAVQNQNVSSGGYDYLFVSGNAEGNIPENYAIIRLESLTVGNVKMSVSAKASHPSAYLDIKNMYLMGE